MKSIAMRYCFLSVLVSYERAMAGLLANGSNVCTKQQSFAQAFKESYNKRYDKHVSFKCRSQKPGSWWVFVNKTCYKTQVDYRVAYRQVYRVAYKTIYTCCKGWQQSGNSCTTPCPENRYGPGCNKTCQCQNATCDVHNGFCSCAPGWTGEDCESICHRGSYGNKCQRTCRCQNNATCDHVTGVCTCRPGYQGLLREKLCDSGYYGDECKESCHCIRGSCDHVNGSCTCPKGYIGARCEKSCPVGLYGTNCSKFCSCPANSTCTTVDGSCVCPKGFQGKSCNKKCSKGYYGSSCQSKCSCHEYESCEPIDGKCKCEGISCHVNKTSSEKQAKDTIVVTACVLYRKCRNETSKPQEQQDYDVTENAECRDTSNAQSDVNITPSYMELRHVAQPSRDHHVYLCLKSRVQHEMKPRDIGTDSSAVDRELYQPLNADRRIYQALNKTIDADKANSDSPVAYGNLPTGQHRVDVKELYITILPDQDVKSSNNVTYNKQHRVYDNCTNSPVLYGNLPSARRNSK